MSDADVLVRQVLDEHTPLRSERRPDWANVLARATESRADTPERRRHVRRRYVLVAVALLAAAAIVTAALAASGVYPFADAPAPPGNEEAQLALAKEGPVNAQGTHEESSLVSVREDGSNMEVLVPWRDGGFTYVDSPSWSPDGQQLYFIGQGESHDTGQFVYADADVYVVDADGGEPQRLTTSGDVGSVAASPDGQRLLVTRFEHPVKLPFSTSLWVMSSDGRDEQRLLDTDNERRDEGGSWSPDGATIAFTRCADTCDIYTVSSDGSGLRRLAARSSQPAFSPDGRTIAFISDRDENGTVTTGEDEAPAADELYVMDSDGGRQRRLTDSANVSEGEPSWSPDGARLTFSRTGQARFRRQVMLANADGTCPRILSGDANDGDPGASSLFSPVWRPGGPTVTRPPLTCEGGL